MRHRNSSKLLALCHRDRQRLPVFLARNRELQRQARRAKAAASRLPNLSEVRPEDGDPVLRSAQRHGLTFEQVRLVRHRLILAKKLHGRADGIKEAFRLGGIVASVKVGRVGNSSWGRSMLASRGGRAMALHAPHILKAIAPLGARAAQVARRQRKALDAIEQERRMLAAMSPEQRAIYEHQRRVLRGQRPPRMRSWLEW